MKLVAHSTLRPTVTTSSSGIALTMTGQVETYAQLENGSFVYTFTMGLVRESGIRLRHTFQIGTGSLLDAMT